MVVNSFCQLYCTISGEELFVFGNKKCRIYAVCGVSQTPNIDSLLRGNQVGDKQEYQNELIELLKDCSAFEKCVIFEQARAIKKIIRESLPLVENKEKY